MDGLGGGVRGPSSSRSPAGLNLSGDPVRVPRPSGESADAAPFSALHDEAVLKQSAEHGLSAEVLAEMHQKVDLPDEPESADTASESEAPSDRATPSDRASLSVFMQAQVARKTRELVGRTARERLSDRTDATDVQAEAPPEAGGSAADARRLADGIVPSMMEGLLNTAHRKEKRDRKDAARLLLIVLKAHGAYVYEHCTRLVDLAHALAREMGERSETLDREVEDGLVYRDIGEVAFFLTRRSARQRDALAAYLGGDALAQDAVLHDLGKIQVPEEILYKPGPLDKAERAVMERHPVWGAEILETVPPLHHAIPVTRHHHERYDGEGYPDRLAGEQIPLAARIVCVVDAFDAMVSDRPYRRGLPVEEACRIIRDGAGTQFDPRAAEAFLRIVHRVWAPDRQY